MVTTTAHRRKARHRVPRSAAAPSSGGRNFILFAAAVYAIVCLYSLWHWVSQPVRNWDMMGYIGCIVSMETKDPAEIRARVMAEIKPVVWDRLYQQYAEENHLSNNDDNFYRQLPFYRIKPLYVGAVWLFHQIGFGLAESTWLVSAVSFVAIAGLLAWWKPERANYGVWLLAVAALMGLGYLPLGTFAGYSVPDPLSLAFFLLAFMGWMRKGSLPLYAGGSLCSILARPDALIQVMAMTVYFAFFAAKERRMTREQAGIAAAACLAGYIGIRLYFGAGSWSEMFYRGLIDDNFDFTKGEAHVSIAQYFRALWSGIGYEFWKPGYWHGRIYVMLAASAASVWAAWKHKKELRWHWLWLLGLNWAAFGGRFALFPVTDERYFYCYYLFIIMALLELAAPFFNALLAKRHPLTEALKWSVKN